MPVSVSEHPIVQHCLAGLRDSSTQPEEFRVLARRVITFLLYEATRDLPVRDTVVRTPLQEAGARQLETEVVAIPVLRAGLGLLGPVLELLPRVSVGYIGLERDEETAVARIYYNKLPSLAGKVPLLLDPMLATGGSGARAIELIKEAGGSGTRMICVVAAPEGIRALEESHPEVQVFTAAVDQGLNDRAFIVPGLGDFGDRLFGDAMSELDGYRERLVAARDALAATPRLGPGESGPPDEKTGERWDRTNVLGHVAEMLPYWTSQTRAVIGGSGEMGRGEAGYARRREGIDSGKVLTEEELRAQIDAGIDGLTQLLGEMRDEDLDRPVVYRPKDGDRQETVRSVLEELMVGHLEAHVRQLQDLTPG